MEHVGQLPTTIFGTVHTTSTVSMGTSGNDGTLSVQDACTAFHNYQLTWMPDRIVFSMDGRSYHTHYNDGTGNASWPFNKPQYMLLNLVVGGNMAGRVDDNILPRSFEIDYVRVYQKK